MEPEVYMSFLVRLWRDHLGSDRPGCWQCELEHVQTGTRCRFSTLDELLAFLRQAAITPPSIAPVAAEQPSTVKIGGLPRSPSGTTAGLGITDAASWNSEANE